LGLRAGLKAELREEFCLCWESNPSDPAQHINWANPAHILCFCQQLITVVSVSKDVPKIICSVLPNFKLQVKAESIESTVPKRKYPMWNGNSGNNNGELAYK
jgi:hypothetical protein